MSYPSFGKHIVFSSLEFVARYTQIATICLRRKNRLGRPLNRWAGRTPYIQMSRLDVEEHSGKGTAWRTTRVSEHDQWRAIAAEVAPRRLEVLKHDPSPQVLYTAVRTAVVQSDRIAFRALGFVRSSETKKSNRHRRTSNGYGTARTGPGPVVTRHVVPNHHLPKRRIPGQSLYRCNWGMPATKPLERRPAALITAIHSVSPTRSISGGTKQDAASCTKRLRLLHCGTAQKTRFTQDEYSTPSSGFAVDEIFCVLISRHQSARRLLSARPEEQYKGFTLFVRGPPLGLNFAPGLVVLPLAC
ncbi:hypothetical protein B0H14DRAFT_2612696 [Mycena olivaceomarginata]|nr:hypothetical protein B0H14DRAFT_2612696 [Mycena olivaceomarginata]